MKRLWPLAIVPLVALSIVIPVNGKTIPRTEIQFASGNAAMTVNPNTGKPGQSVMITGSGFSSPGGQGVVRLKFGGATIGTDVPVSSSGAFSTTIRVPSVPAGKYTITATGFAPGTTPAGATPTDTPQAPAAATDTPSPTNTVAPTNTAAPGITNTVPPATAVPTNTSQPATPTNTSVAPTSVPPTVVPPTSVPPTSVPPTSPPPPTAYIQPPGPTQVPPPTRGPSPVPPTLVPTVVPPTPIPTFCEFCGMAGGALSSHMIIGKRQLAAGAAATLQPTGQTASATFTVTAPSGPPIGLTQSATCVPEPTVGITSSCTITQIVTNNTNHPLDFSHTVVNHLSRNVQAISTSAQVGAIVSTGSNVVWNNFTLAPGQSVSASIRVSFTPSSSQVGQQVALSDGITADAIDTVTHTRLSVSFGVLVTTARVHAHAGAGGPVPASAPATGPKPVPAPAPQPAPAPAPAAPAGGTGRGVNSLPSTGGGA